MIDRIATDVASETQTLASAIASAPPAVIADIKKALNANSDLRGQLALEKEHQLRAFLSSESAQRVAAFLTKDSGR